jgi:hypothetical protein
MSTNYRRRMGPGFEHRQQPVLAPHLFVRRQLRHFGYSSGIIGFSLAMGTAGYCYFGQMNLLDGFYSATMILTGMGPVTVLTTAGGKLFASFFALYSSLAFLSTSAILLAPAIHRILHLLNVDDRN